MPVTPVESGKPVALVRTTADGVPSAGVTSVGDVERTLLPVPVFEIETKAPPDDCTAPDARGVVIVPVNVGDANGAAPVIWPTV